MKTFEHAGATLAYDDNGRSGAPPLVFIHGLSSARTTWARITPGFDTDFHIFAFDQRGHGQSSHVAGTYVLERYVDDAIAFCAEVIGEPALIVGHSLGGVVAFAVAVRRPDVVRAVFLEDPPLYRGERADDGGPAEPPPANSIASFFPVLRQLLAGMQERNAPLDEYLAMLNATPAMNGNGTLAGVMGPDGARAHAEAWAALDPSIFDPAIDGGALAGAQPDTRLACPLHLLRADPELSAAFTPDDEARLLQSNPDAVVWVVEGASHIIHDEQPVRFIDELAGCLGRGTGMPAPTVRGPGGDSALG